MCAERTLKPTLHTVYRNIRVIKQATIKQYLIVGNTWQHMQHFRIVDTLLKLLASKAFPCCPTRSHCQCQCQSRTPWGHPMLSCLCPPYDKPHSARFLHRTLPSPHPCSAVYSVQQSGWVRIIKNKLTCVPIISTALAAGSLLAVSFAVPHSGSVPLLHCPLSHCPSVLPLSSPGSLSVVVVADMCFLWTTTKTEIDVRIAYKNKE